MLRDNRKSWQQMAKIMADICDNRRIYSKIRVESWCQQSSLNMDPKPLQSTSNIAFYTLYILDRKKWTIQTSWKAAICNVKSDVTVMEQACPCWLPSEQVTKDVKCAALSVVPNDFLCWNYKINNYSKYIRVVTKSRQITEVGKNHGIRGNS